MANEFSVSAGASFSDSNGTDSVSVVTKRLDSADCIKVVGQSVSSSAVELTWPSATNRIGAAIHNTGDTNNVTISVNGTGGDYNQICPPGAVVVVLLASGSGTIFIKSASGSTYNALTA
jgi:hypothetical protein